MTRALESPSNDSTSIAKTGDRLCRYLHALPGAVVAFSGGVDSAVVAKAAAIALGPLALAVTANSPSLPAGEVEAAQVLAEEIGIAHRTITTLELENPNYVRNLGDRCFWCKTELYSVIRAAESIPSWPILNGTNLDDLGDYRPGLKAADDFDVIQPLVECRLDKKTVRDLARHWGLSAWDKPAGPCLASRISPGVAVTAECLRRIDLAEAFFRNRGFPIVRVRQHADELVRIEIPIDRLVDLFADGMWQAAEHYVKNLGFRFVTVDLSGFRSGIFNPVIALQSATTKSTQGE